VNKSDLIEVVTARLGDRRTASTAVEAVVDAITRAVAKGEKVGISGFGVFEPVDRAARTARNPTTGEAVRLEQTRVPKFRPGQGFKDIVSGAKEVDPNAGPRAVTARAGVPRASKKLIDELSAEVADGAAPAKAGTSTGKAAAKAPAKAAKAVASTAAKAVKAPAKAATKAAKAATKAASPASPAVKAPAKAAAKAGGRTVAAPGARSAAAAKAPGRTAAKATGAPAAKAPAKRSSS
jgi:DNA-binding protein HU-beta